MIKKINFLFVTLFGIGKIKKIPGSIASLATILFLFFLFHIVNIDPNIVLISLIIIFCISLYAVNIFIKDLDDKDPKEIVIDEFIGQSIVLIFLPLTLQNYILGFIFFRIFDIYKPMPINYFEKKYQNAFGIIFDDIIAAGYALLAIYIINIII